MLLKWCRIQISGQFFGWCITLKTVTQRINLPSIVLHSWLALYKHASEARSTVTCILFRFLFFFLFFNQAIANPHLVYNYNSSAGFSLCNGGLMFVVRISGAVWSIKTPNIYLGSLPCTTADAVLTRCTNKGVCWCYNVSAQGGRKTFFVCFCWTG